MLVAGILLAIIGVGAGATAWIGSSYGDEVTRVSDAFPAGARPSPASAEPGETEPLTFLLIGVDAEAPDVNETTAGSINLVRFDGDQKHAQVITLPSDTSVGALGQGGRTLDATYGADGTAGLVKAVEEITGVRINNVAVLDFAGFRTITDALGGIEVNVTSPVNTPERSFRPGVQRLDGRAALEYTRPEPSAKVDDQDTIRRQQQVIGGIFASASQQGLLTNLGKLTEFLTAITGALQVDDTLNNTDLIGLAFNMRGLTAANISYISVPISGIGREAGKAVAYLDEARADVLWGYLKTDDLTEHVGDFKG